MEGKKFKGKVEARIIDLRFALSGKLAVLIKRRGDLVKKGELVASLDKKLLQAELDKQLKDYEKVRAEFEIFNLEKGEPMDDIAKYLKSGKQAQLDISVKEVELAKARLDQADLFSPLEGIIIDDSDLVTGIYLTPSSNPIKVLETSSYYFEFGIEQESLAHFLNEVPMTVKIIGIEKTYLGKSKAIIPSPDGKLKVEVKLDDVSGLIFGLEGEAGF